MRKFATAIFAAILAAILSVGCTSTKRSDKECIYVSIAPLKPLIHGIVGDDFDIEVLVPAGASPETFEPTPKQFIALNEARMIFNVGLIDFERNLISKVRDKEKVVDLSRNVEVIAGSCSHNHHGHECAHGVDPHIWCSPKQLAIMAENAFEAIHAALPDSLKYNDNYTALCNKLLDLDEEVAEMCKCAPSSYFLIYHPALTYLARDYGLEQVSIENEGKETSAKRLGEIIDMARRDGIKRVFYQSQFPRSSVETVCEDIGAEAVEINPLDEEIFGNIRHMVYLITEN